MLAQTTADFPEQGTVFVHWVLKDIEVYMYGGSRQKSSGAGPAIPQVEVQVMGWIDSVFDAIWRMRKVAVGLGAGAKREIGGLLESAGLELRQFGWSNADADRFRGQVC